MKRVGNLIEQVVDLDNLYLAFHKAQQGKSGKQEVTAYRADLEKNLYKLRGQLLTGKVKVGKYKLFKIYDPKERTVCAAAFDERVFHHALMNVCAPFFERHFIETTYANRKGKGVYKALERAYKAMSRYRYVAKLDVRKYFDNIDHEHLQQRMARLFKDACLLEVLETIIDSYHVTEGKGVPIGNLTSQYFANFYLSGLDHYAKEELCVSEFIRYMDDMLLYGNERDELIRQVEAICIYAKNELDLEMKSPIVQRTTESIAFLGYRLRRHCITLTTRSKRRFENKFRKAKELFTNRTWGETEYQAHLMPLFAFVRHAYTKRYRKHVIEKVSVVGF